MSVRKRTFIELHKGALGIVSGSREWLVIFNGLTRLALLRSNETSEKRLEGGQGISQPYVG